jgi:hypothetical protein
VEPVRPRSTLPNHLTHYYRETPLQTLCDLSDAEAAQVLNELGERRELDYRLTRPEYLPRRREIEATMRQAFIAKGGRPYRRNPHYFVVGHFSLYEDDAGWRALRVPIACFDPGTISFTNTDSFFAYSQRNLRGVPIPPRPYHGQVFRLDELEDLVSQHGLPGERWRDDPECRFDVYIEAQVWDDRPLRAYLALED